MDVARALSRPTALTAAAVLAAFGLALVPAAPASANPSLSEVERQVEALGTKLDATNEKYNAAKVDLEKVRREQKAMQTKLDAAQQKLDAAQAKVGEIAASAYRGNQLGMWGSLIESGSPRTFMDQLTVLEQLTLDQRGAIDAATRAKEQVAAAKAPVDANLKKAAALEKTLRDQQAQLNKDLVKWKALRARLGGRGPSSPGSENATYDGSASGNAEIVVRFAYAQLGKPYVFGAAGPNSYDCSGLTMAAWARAGVYLPHSASRQYRALRKVSRSNLRPGDIVLFYSDLHHNGIYIGGNRVIHAPQPGDNVKIASMNYMPYAGAVRP